MSGVAINIYFLNVSTRHLIIPVSGVAINNIKKKCSRRHQIIPMSGVHIHTRHTMIQTSSVTRQIMQALFHFQTFVCIDEQAILLVSHKMTRINLLFPPKRLVNKMAQFAITGEAFK